MPRKTYTNKFKIEVINAYENGKSKDAIIKEYDLTLTTLNSWIAKHKKDQERIIELEKQIEEKKNEINILRETQKQEQIEIAWNLYNESFDVSSVVERRKILKHALKIHPEFVECELALIELLPNKEKALELLIALVAKLKDQLVKEGYFEEVGHFWGIVETRPYMQALYSLAAHYTKVEEYQKALNIIEEMLVLCPSDNLGARYRLLPLYFMTENHKKVKDILKEEYEHTLTSLVNLLVILLIIQDEAKMVAITNEIMEIDENSYYYLLGFVKMPKKIIKEIVTSGYYEYGTIEETIMAVRSLPAPLCEVVEDFGEMIQKNL